MQTYGLLGYPLGHSFSAGYFAEKFRKQGIDAEYVNFEFPDVASAVSHLRSLDYLCGFNVTIPYKQQIIPYLDTLSPEAREMGAVNVVCVRRDAAGNVRWHGDNSDWIGFSRSLQPLLDSKLHRRALVLGTGGASKAVVYALRRLGLQTLYVSRTAVPGRITYQDLTPDCLAEHLVLVNCSPVGMFPHVDECPDVPYHLLSSLHLLYDLVYNPLETLFMKRGAAQGATVKNGLEMLHLQAEAAWEMWHDRQLPEG